VSDGRRRPPGARCLAAAVLALGSSAAAQNPAGGAGPAEYVVRATGGFTLPPRELRDRWAEALGDPELLNEALTLPPPGGRRWRLLRDLDLRFKSFESDETERRGLGISYAFERQRAVRRFSARSARQSGAYVAVNAAGNVAVDRRSNPRDFLDTRVSANIFRSWGGVVDTASDSLRNELNRLEDALTSITDGASLAGSPVLARFLGAVREHLSTQRYLALSGSARVESDQSLRRRQYVYAVLLGADVKAWNTESALARFNVFDWPFAAVRWLADHDAEFRPRGSSIPTLQLEVASVAPQGDDGREALGVRGTYPRLRVESSFRTPLAASGRTRLSLESNYRLYQELGAPATIRRAELARFSYLAAAITSAAGPYVSYSAGRLPLDRARDRVYELGFQTRF